MEIQLVLVSQTLEAGIQSKLHLVENGEKQSSLCPLNCENILNGKKNTILPDCPFLTNAYRHTKQLALTKFLAQVK